MFRIWAKLLEDGKIKKQLMYERDEKFVYSQFFYYLSDICEGLDIATPILLKTHIFNYAKFNIVTFRKRDFADTFEYDKLVLENVVL